ncbi:MAG: ATP-binding cassette domain-containing protein [Anaerolineae bacterium]|nr:ATP-binding cassette domain-containing protein [Anaerolineae bacterium]
MQNEKAIEVSSVSKSFGATLAVDNVSFDIQRGEIFAMLGPNGAGKTTTIRMVLDILKPDAGAIRVLGGRLDEAKKDRIGYLPEERGLYRDVKVVECLAYLGQLKGMSGADSRRKAGELLERVELADVADKKVSELSRGMQQKVQFAATLIHEPDLIIIDEPFSGLDPVNTLLIKDLLYETRDRGTTIVMSTHQMHQIEEMADRLFMIHHGHRVLYGTVEEVRSQFALHAIEVEGAGDWSTVPGVARVAAAENGREYTLTLEDGVTTDDIMRALANSPDHHVRRLEEAIPSLNEVFIKVVREMGEDLNGDNHA